MIHSAGVLLGQRDRGCPVGLRQGVDPTALFAETLERARLFVDRPTGAAALAGSREAVRDHRGAGQRVRRAAGPADDPEPVEVERVGELDHVVGPAAHRQRGRRFVRPAVPRSVRDDKVNAGRWVAAMSGHHSRECGVPWKNITGGPSRSPHSVKARVRPSASWIDRSA